MRALRRRCLGLVRFPTKAVILGPTSRVRLVLSLILTVAVATVAAADDIPLPRPRPATLGASAPAAAAAVPDNAGATDGEAEPEAPREPSACRLRLTDLAQLQPLPPVVGNGACGAEDPVRLEAIVLADKTRVAVTPPAVMRCGLAEAVVRWVRDDIAPAALTLGAALKTIENAASYECRGRNRIVGAKLSEHGKGNAIDIRAVRLASGAVAALTDSGVAQNFRETLKASACRRFTTVLGPGSDGYHEHHVHVDLAERRGGYRMCQWAVHVPAPPPQPAPQVAEAAAEEEAETAPEAADIVNVPLPRPRPLLAHDARAPARFDGFRRRP
jgi:hypothetical protein